MRINRNSLSGWLTLILCGISLLATSRTAPAQAGQPAAQLIALSGNAEIKSSGETTFHPAKIKDVLHQQDQIRTLANSRAKLFFQDETILVLSDNTTIDIANFQMNPQGGRQSALMKILHGSLRFIVTQASAADKPNFEIQGATAVMGIRGTDGIFESRSPDTIYFLSGRSILDIFNRTTGERLTLTPDNFVSSLPGQPLRTGIITPMMRQQLMGNFRVAQSSPPPAVTQPPPPPSGLTAKSPQQDMDLGNPLIQQDNPFLNTLNPSTQGGGNLVAPLPPVHPPLNPR